MTFTKNTKIQNVMNKARLQRQLPHFHRLQEQLLQTRASRPTWSTKSPTWKRAPAIWRWPPTRSSSTTSGRRTISWGGRSTLQCWPRPGVPRERCSSHRPVGSLSSVLINLGIITCYFSYAIYITRLINLITVVVNRLNWTCKLRVSSLVFVLFISLSLLTYFHQRSLIKICN